MAERSSPYDQGLRHGVADPSAVPDRIWNQHVKQKREADEKARLEEAGKIAAAMDEHAKRMEEHRANSPLQSAVDDAIAAGVDRASVVLSPEARRLQSLGMVKLEDGTLVSKAYLERQRQQQAQPASDGFTDWAPFIDENEALRDVENQEDEG